MARHLLHLYTGDGKGKTTAAMGLALRMLGHGRTVLIAQFMKDGTSGELRALRQFGRVTLFEGARMEGFVFRMTEPELEEAREQQSRAVSELSEKVRSLRPDLTVLDELAVALATRMVGRADAERLLDAALESGDAVVTGRGAPDWLRERADYVSDVAAVKRRFEEGQAAREGIEW